MFDERLGFVGLTLGQSLLFPAAGPQQHGSKKAGHHAADYSEFRGHLLPQIADLAADGRIRQPKLPLHGPQQTTVPGLDRPDFPLETLADAWIRIVLISLPTFQGGAADAEQAGAVTLEIA